MTHEELIDMCARLGTERDALRVEVAALRKDAERLDFIADNGISCDRVPLGDTKFDVWRNGVRYSGKTPRDAIDAAISADKQIPGPFSVTDSIDAPQPPLDKEKP